MWLISSSEKRVTFTGRYLPGRSYIELGKVAKVEVSQAIFFWEWEIGFLGIFFPLL